MLITREIDSLKIDNHVLRGRNVEQIKREKTFREMNAVSAAVIHYTAGANAKSSVNHLASPQIKECAHVVICKTGMIYQLADLNKEVAHAGISILNGRAGVNKFSIGIELDNYGKLERVGDHFYTEFKRQVKFKDVYTHYKNGVVSYWEMYPDIQIERLIELLRLLIRKYPIFYIVGHSDITNRKVDPGPAFPFDEVRKRVYGYSFHHDCTVVAS